LTNGNRRTLAGMTVYQPEEKNAANPVFKQLNMENSDFITTDQPILTSQEWDFLAQIWIDPDQTTTYNTPVSSDTINQMNHGMTTLSLDTTFNFDVVQFPNWEPLLPVEEEKIEVKDEVISDVSIDGSPESVFTPDGYFPDDEPKEEKKGKGAKRKYIEDDYDPADLRYTVPFDPKQSNGKRPKHRQSHCPRKKPCHNCKKYEEWEKLGKEWHHSCSYRQYYKQ
jgi:hypothetical protein